MPKLSLGRRHRRQQNLSAMQRSALFGSSTSPGLERSGPRAVSDEDIHQSDGSGGGSNTAAHDSEIRTRHAEPPQSDASSRRVGQLKRPASSACLFRLVGDDIDDEVSPIVLGTDDEGTTDDGSGIRTCKTVGDTGDQQLPWGHFVDMVIPSEEEEEGNEFSSPFELSKMASFPSPAFDRAFHPYPCLLRTSKRRRTTSSPLQRLRRQHRKAKQERSWSFDSKKLSNDDDDVSRNAMVDAAQTALRDLRM